MKKILFLCTGNSCRSQMAEGWARHLHGDKLEAYSAGINPHGIHPLTLQVMKEAGVDISAQSSKHIRVVKDIDFDYVITLCDSARESCPLFPGKIRILHYDFEDPAAAHGSDSEVISAFRRVRDQIRDFTGTLPALLNIKKP
ncbi:MAG: arsenate reductase [Elusimicrobia bacterium GWA2_56_46]|nr:MAG: arsenate reductase [Elusimicrobia bacterium GWA2_56_46]OGR55613.1 MAG: arsenate reductase [Elusimicrobia bacterium GWC2_56_31]HBB67451.1 arsenate reductase [Elusimicrobiota bacterium]HBW22027.1 arsenate reductase [Elusimicrobiota bacterium]